jgi:signal peptidase II
LSAAAGEGRTVAAVMRRLRPRLLAFVPAVLVVLVLDQLTKHFVRAHLTEGAEPTKLLPFLDLRHVRNTGIAFSLLSDQVWLVLLFTVVVLVVLGTLMVRAKPTDRLTLVGVGGIAGGALGNLTDRLRLGYVTDFIHLPHWPTFNVADCGIVGGVALVVLRQWREPLPEVNLDDEDDWVEDDAAAGGDVAGASAAAPVPARAAAEDAEPAEVDDDAS